MTVARRDAADDAALARIVSLAQRLATPDEPYPGVLEELATLLATLAVPALVRLAPLLDVDTYRSQHWWRFAPTAVAARAALRDGWAAAALLSLHANGRVRQAALHALVEEDDARVLPFVLLRANDWVPVIRSEAVAAVERMVRSAWVATWVRCLPLVERLERGRRSDHRPLIERIFTLLRSAGGSQLRDAAESDDAWFRRCAARLLLEAEPREAARLLRNADPTVRTAAARALVNLDGNVLAESYALASRDRFASVRLEALRAAIARLPNAQGSLELALFDPARSVRERARYELLRARPERSFAADYRSAFEHRPTAPALAGLVETGDAADVAHVVALLDDAPPRTRRWAMCFVAARLPPTRAAALVADADYAIAKLAARALVGRVDEAVVAALFAHVPTDERVERLIARLIGRLGMESAARQLLLLAARARHAAVAIDALERWLRRDRRDDKARPYARSPARERLLTDALAVARPRLPATLAERLERRLRAL